MWKSRHLCNGEEGWWCQNTRQLWNRKDEEWHLCIRIIPFSNNRSCYRSSWQSLITLLHICSASWGSLISFNFLFPNCYRLFLEQKKFKLLQNWEDTKLVFSLCIIVLMFEDYCAQGTPQWLRSHSLSKETQVWVSLTFNFARGEVLELCGPGFCRILMGILWFSSI